MSFLILVFIIKVVCLSDINLTIPLPVNGWITCDFMFVSTVFQSYEDDEQVIIKGCVQWNPVYD